MAQAESSRAGDSLDLTWPNLCVMGLLCSCITLLIHVAICIEALQIHKCDTPQSIHVLIFFQLKAFTFCGTLGKIPFSQQTCQTHSFIITEEVRLLLQCEALSAPEFILNFIIIVFSCKYFPPFCQLYMSNDLIHPASAHCFFTTSHIMAAVYWWLTRELT